VLRSPHPHGVVVCLRFRIFHLKQWCHYFEEEPMKKTYLLSLALALLLAAQSFAQLVVNTDLGALATPSVTNLVGTTVGGNTNADFYPPVSFDESLGEYVYQFSLSATSLLSMVNNEGIFVGADNDQFMLNGLSVTAGNADNVYGFVDEQGSFGIFSPGTYYLSVDTFAFSFEGPYDIDLIVDADPGYTPPLATDLGKVGTAGDVYSINTYGSSFDTELCLYDSVGNLLAANDDAGGGLQSEIITTNASMFRAPLNEGTYHVALGGFNTICSVGFSVTGGTSTGSYDLTIDNLTQGMVAATAHGTTGLAEIDWYSFNVNPIPEPSTAALLLVGLGAMLAARRRR
jgi:hypothetical protein